MIRVLDVAAFGEATTGLALVVAPSFVGKGLLGEALTGAAIPTARVAGIALIAVGIACWRNSAVGMLMYSTAVTFYIAYVGLWGGFSGILLWPAVALHALISILLSRDY
ncbi:hypothetical protein [Mycoplana dimorpha]